jgi:hypothetical protein
MRTFPNYISTLIDGNITRALMLTDCAPGDIIFFPSGNHRVPHIAFQHPNAASMATIELNNNNLTFKAGDEHAQVVKLGTQVHLQVDHASRKPLIYGDRPRCGSFVVDERGGGLVFKTGDAVRVYLHVFDLATHARRELGSEGFEFQKWSLRLDGAPEETDPIYTFDPPIEDA